LLTLLAYSNSFHGDFTLDCTRLLRLDHRIQQVTVQNVDEIFYHTYWWPYGETGLYRPLSSLSYMFNYAVLGNGERATGYHWTNFILHVCNVLLVYALSLRLMGSRSRAFAVAALWSVHPVLTESVTYIVGRPELLSGLGVLGGFLLYLAATETTGLRRWTALGGCAAATAIGVFSKESAVAVAGVIAVYELAWRKERRQVRGRFAGWIAVAVPIAAMLYVRLQVLTASPSARFPFLDNPMVSAGFIEGRLTAIGMVARYSVAAGLSPYSVGRLFLRANSVVPRHSHRPGFLSSGGGSDGGRNPVVSLEPHSLLFCRFRRDDVPSSLEPAVPHRHNHG